MPMSPDASITRIWDRDIVETRRRVRKAARSEDHPAGCASRDLWRKVQRCALRLLFAVITGSASHQGFFSRLEGCLYPVPAHSDSVVPFHA
jgi:hypothetical protein